MTSDGPSADVAVANPHCGLLHNPAEVYTVSCRMTDGLCNTGFLFSCRG